MSLNPLKWLDAARTIDRIFQLEKKHGALLEAQQSAIQELKDRLITLEQRVEAREEILVAKAEGAAAAAASNVTANQLAELGRLIGTLQAQVQSLNSTQGPQKQIPGKRPSKRLNSHSESKDDSK